MFKPRITLAALPMALVLAACNAPDVSMKATDSWRIVLAPQDGSDAIDQQIKRTQEQVQNAENPVPHLERLGHLFVAKARLTFDPGYYRLAEECSRCIETALPDSPEALLLRGHVLHSLHRFAEAKAAAIGLVEQRGSFLDHGLLGDVLLDLGDIESALPCYEKMMEQKPCLQSYSRMAQVCWLKGEVEAARDLLRMAAAAGSRRSPEPLAWTLSRLASVELQLKDLSAASEAAAAALDVLPRYAPALLAKGKIKLAENNLAEAVLCLEGAAASNPIPEYHWALAEVYREAGLATKARDVETALEKRGASEDSRTFALFLASRNLRPNLALRLAQDELNNRRDVHTHDAHAWALHASGHEREATTAIGLALAEGTVDARIFYHAGAIAAANADTERARHYLQRAEDLRHVLWPSEQHDLSRQLSAL